ncbi:LPS translocon maturation chaperone LptM [Marinobacter changyiensis]|uniref:LPS translocon maturation chaperone LptM n=1 Tax=Marinobacter changyiensis TaxID=2604091 RepID=UPI001265086F|nr:lipoprotein [Marinobacter changyiensis]
MLARGTLVLVLLAAGLLGGCGQKGPLYRGVPVDLPPAAAEPAVGGQTADEREPG